MKKNQILFLQLILLLSITTEKQIKKKSIFEEVQLKNLKLKNRIIRGSVGDLCGLIDGKINEESLKLYNQLSDDGVGLIITGCTNVADYY